jgi:serine/threonine protein kinase
MSECHVGMGGMQYDSSAYGSVLEAMSALEAKAKVGDFGLSRKIQHGHSHTSGMGQGTPFFVAPEVAGQRRLHKSSDAYSFGVMMWELCVGCPVYTVQQSAPRLLPLCRVWTCKHLVQMHPNHMQQCTNTFF